MIPEILVASSPIILPFAFTFPETVSAPNVPTLVNEELITPLPRVSEVKTSVPAIS